MEVKELESAIEEDSKIKKFIDKMVTNAVAEAVTEATSALKSTNTDLKSEKTKMQKILDKMPSSEQLEEFKKLQLVIDSSEDAKLIAEGKVDEVINRRVEKTRLEYEDKTKKQQEELEAAQAKVGTVTSEFDTHRINNAMRQQAVEAGVDPKAISDVVSRANGLFTINDKGEFVSLDSEGHHRTNEAGTPLDMKVFVADLKESAPHFWPGSVSASLGGSGEGANDSLVIAANKGNTAGYVDGRRKQLKEKREAQLK